MKKYILKYLIIGLLITSCSDFLEVDFPDSQLSGTQIFENEATANAALANVYSELRDNVLLTGDQGLSLYMGLYADELDYYGFVQNPQYNFYTNSLIPSNSSIASIWNGAYNVIYDTNSIIEGVQNSESLSIAQKRQFQGEALFLRGLVHFYLVNLFGNVPYVKSTDYVLNSSIGQMNENEIYENVISDLSSSKEMLSEEYTSEERIRPNKFTVSFLLSKVYLYNDQWNLAEEESSNVINSNQYTWDENINNIFQKESPTTIWQLKPAGQGFDNALESNTFIFYSIPPPNIALSINLIDSFEENDLRRLNWVGEISESNITFYYPYKYKGNEDVPQYSIIFRLAEQYLIRAEARAHLNNVAGSQDDINKIRIRAGLTNTTANDLEGLLSALVQERKVELFTEQGNRWFDLKRLDIANNILSPLKPGWNSTDVLFPIPETEILTNSNLLQNPGY